MVTSLCRCGNTFSFFVPETAEKHAAQKGERVSILWKLKTKFTETMCGYERVC